MGVSTSAGAKLYIGTTASNGVTDTYTEVGQIVTIPEYGRKYNVVKYTPLDFRGTLKFKGSYDDGSLAVDIGKDATDAGQVLCIAAVNIDLDYNFQISLNDAVAPSSATGITVSVASPGVVADPAHGLPVNTAVIFSGTGTLPTGLALATTYYIKTVTDAGHYTLSATLGGSAINTTGSMTGTVTRTTVPAPTSQLLKAKVTSYTTKIGSADSVIGSTLTLEVASGSIVETPHIP